MVLVDDAQHFVVEHQLVAHAQAEFAVQLQQLLLWAGEWLAFQQHLARDLQLADIVQQRAHAENMTVLAVQAELATE